MKLNSHSNIYKWAFQDKEDDKDTATSESHLGDMLKTNKDILDSKETKDTSLVKTIQLNDINHSSKSK